MYRNLRSLGDPLSARFFNYLFSAAPLSRNGYVYGLAEDSQRSGPVNYFTGRLFNIQTHNKTEFNGRQSAAR
jgi:hypothetical protein